MFYNIGFAQKVNKEFEKYELNNDYVLKQNKHYVIRLDGVHMTRNFIGKEVFRELFKKTMRDTVTLFMKEDPTLKVCYSYCDEISILLEKELLEKYQYRLEKIISIIASKITCSFIYCAIANELPVNDKLRAFDARIIELDNLEHVTEYIKARQLFAITTHILSLKNKYLKNTSLSDSNDIIARLKLDGIDYQRLSYVDKYGLLWVNKGFQPLCDFTNDYHSKLYQMILNRHTVKTVFNKKRTIKV